MTLSTAAITLLALFASLSSAQDVVPIDAATSTIIPYPTATLANADAQSFVSTRWGISKGRIQNGVNDVTFVADPFPNSPAPRVSSNTSGPVLQVLYPAGSYSDNNAGGTQFYNLWNTTTPFQSMVLSYEIAFDTGYDWIKGGKLPGLRGGVPNGCSGGNQADGVTCFSTRLMWRKNGQGEVYAYIPRVNSICSAKGVRCNDEYGASIGRGAFSFASGQWNKITMAIWLNSPADTANGRVQVYYNNILAIDKKNLVFRTTENLTANGLYFSTFFGGNDKSWAPTRDSKTYFRNIELFGGPHPSNLTGSKIGSGASSVHHLVGGAAWVFAAACAALLTLLL